MSNVLQHSVVHRLPSSYRRCNGAVGVTVEPQSENGFHHDDDWIGFCLLSHSGESAWDVMQQIRQILADIRLECMVLELEGEPHLFVYRQDECATTCRLKNFGVGIAESFPAKQEPTVDGYNPVLVR